MHLLIDGDHRLMLTTVKRHKRRVSSGEPRENESPWDNRRHFSQCDAWNISEPYWQISQHCSLFNICFYKQHAHRSTSQDSYIYRLFYLTLIFLCTFVHGQIGVKLCSWTFGLNSWMLASLNGAFKISAISSRHFWVEMTSQTLLACWKLHLVL